MPPLLIPWGQVILQGELGRVGLITPPLMRHCTAKQVFSRPDATLPTPEHIGFTCGMLQAAPDQAWDFQQPYMLCRRF